MIACLIFKILEGFVTRNIYINFQFFFIFEQNKDVYQLNYLYLFVTYIRVYDMVIEGKIVYLLSILLIPYFKNIIKTLKRILLHFAF